MIKAYKSDLLELIKDGIAGDADEHFERFNYSLLSFPCSMHDDLISAFFGEAFYNPRVIAIGYGYRKGKRVPLNCLFISKGRLWVSSKTMVHVPEMEEYLH